MMEFFYCRLVTILIFTFDELLKFMGIDTYLF
jgi:hypothetical protein